MAACTLAGPRTFCRLLANSCSTWRARLYAEYRSLDLDRGLRARIHRRRRSHSAHTMYMYSSTPSYISSGDPQMHLYDVERASAPRMQNFFLRYAGAAIIDAIRTGPSGPSAHLLHDRESITGTHSIIYTTSRLAHFAFLYALLCCIRNHCNTPESAAASCEIIESHMKSRNREPLLQVTIYRARSSARLERLIKSTGQGPACACPLLTVMCNANVNVLYRAPRKATCFRLYANPPQNFECSHLPRIDSVRTSSDERYARYAYH
ncbi:hypothetical protein BDW22DRAFT_482699 [Trametopsis cervina]|nr:hypothetical protein BDW22DRAFT_482699 [Trametopsis cervina]